MTNETEAVRAGPIVADATISPHLANRVYGKRYGVDWIWHLDDVGLLHPQSEIDRLTGEVDRLRSELQFIAEIDPRDSSNGFNEWGEAECFRVAQERAKNALAPAKKVD